MCRIASPSNGQLSCTAAERSMLLCLVMAPIERNSGVSWMPSNPERKLRSMRTFGLASRRFKSGRRLCPPASILPSETFSCSTDKASSTLPGATYSNGAGFNFKLLARQEGQHTVGAQRDFVHSDRQWQKRVRQSVGNRGRRCNRAPFAEPFYPER